MFLIILEPNLVWNINVPAISIEGTVSAKLHVVGDLLGPGLQVGN